MTINGGRVKTGSIGSGGSNSKNGGTIGAAQVTINGGNVSGQIVMAATGKANPTDEEKCKFTMTGGTLHNDYLDDETFFRMTETKEADGVKITTIYPGGAVYMDDPYGKANISGGAIKNCSSTNGGAVYMTDGEFNLSGTGIIQNCMATENGGAIYMGGAGTAKLNITGGSLRNNTAPENGGAIYMTNGTATISGTGAFMSGTETLDSGSLTDNTATNGNGGAIYLGGGTLTMNGGVLENNTAVNGNGGAIGMGGGKLYITGGSVNTNKAPNGSGGGAYIENGTVIMSGGAVDGNTAREGGGLSVSASSDPADVGVKVFCGSVSGNTATEKGGAIAVVGDPAAEKQNITITIGVNEVHEDANTDGAQDEIKHNEDGNKADAGPYSHLTCPQINGNKVSTIGGSGGALYLTGSVQTDSATRLNLYCLTATGNDVAIPDGENVPDGLSDFMKVEDGKVIISSGTHHTGDINDDGVVDENDDPDGNDGYFSPDGDYKHGDVNIDGSFHVTGGQVDLYGNIDNPSFGNKPITVDVVDGTSDHFVDHRQVNTNTRTVTYVENFLENGVLSGRYTMYHVLVDQAFAIESGMYSHPGYQMVGWYTEKEYPTATGKKYEPGKSVTLPGGYSAEIGTDSLGNLKLYGIWDMFGYTIRFNCNAPTNATVLGSSDPYAQSFTYEETKALTANRFKVKGYAFQGWSMDQSDTVFDPANPKHFTNQKEVGQLTTSDGVTLDFWGIWTVCEHDDAEKIQYSVEQDSDHLNTATLKKTCTACSTTWERTLFASGGTFNGSAYKATLTTTPGWDEDLQIDYAGQSYGGVDYSSTSAPTGAGNYTASVTLPDGTTKATVTYTISKATQSAPPVPSYESAINETQLTLTITKGAPSTKTGLDAQYRLTYQTDNGSYAYIWLDGVGDDTLIPGGADGTVTYQVDLPQTYTWYYLEAYYPETGNYLQSAMVQANEEIQYGGAVLKIVCDPGITCIRKDLGDSRLQLTLEVRPGYHLIGEKFDVQKTTNKNSDQPVLVKQSDGVYVLSNFEEGSTVTVTIGHARKDASITAAIQEKQLFTTTPDDTTASISRDSAFTAYFHVQGYNETDYAYPTLNFGSALPVGTTIIMVDRSSTTNRYYYHNIASATDSIPLTAAEFSTMGGGTAFALGDEMELQFVVDFSRVTNGGPVGNLTVTLSIDAKSGSHAPTVNADVTAALGDPSFTLQTAALTKEEELTAGVLCGYTSGGADSKWDYRHTALVVRSVGNTPLPADTRLKVTQGNDSITRAQNENGEFVIPIDTLKPGEHTMILTLDTRLNPAEAVTYGLQVRWVASDSFADAAPMNGKGLTNPLRIELRKAEDAVPSIRIEAAQLVKNPATSTELKVLPYKVHHENMGGNRLFMSVEIWDQDKGVYSDTGINLGEEGRIFSEENNPMVEQVSMPANMFGSGRMNFRVEDANGKLVTEVYHYFVISTATAQSEEDAGGDDSGASDPTGSGTTENDTTENGTTESGTTEST